MVLAPGLAPHVLSATRHRLRYCWAWDGLHVNYRFQLTAIPIGEGVTNDLLTILQLTSLGEINLFVRLVYLIIGFCFKQMSASVSHG